MGAVATMMVAFAPQTLGLEPEDLTRSASARLLLCRPYLTENTPWRKSPALSVNPWGTEVPRILNGSPTVTACDPAGARRWGRPRSGSASSTSPWTAGTAPPWPPTANRRSRSPWGPKGAFENGNIGTLTRRVPVDRVVNALPPRIRNRRPPKAPRTPRVVELLRKAMEWQALLASGEASNQAAIARREGITHARVTQVMGMLRLAPEIQQHVLSLPNMVRPSAITERALRPIAQLENAADQKAKFQELATQIQ